MYVELDTSLTPEQATLKAEAHRFAAEVLRPAAVALDKLTPEEAIAPVSRLWDALRQAYELGYHVLGLPREHGGAGLSPLERHIVLEEFAWGSMDLAISLACVGAPFGALATFGASRLAAEYLPRFVNDRKLELVGCWGVTEPMHGSDTILAVDRGVDTWESFGVRARLDGDEWILDGQKAAWVSNATIATHCQLLLGVDGPSGKGGGIAFVPLDLPGVTKGKPLNKIGQRALSQGELYFDGVRLPRDCMLVEPPLFPVMHHIIFGGANATMAATSTGLARAAFEEALAYAKGRVQGGKVLCEHQLIQKKLFDMFTKVESARAFSRAAAVYSAASPGPATKYCVAAKVYCTQAAFEVASEAVQIFGGMGLSKEVLVEKLFRDARATLIEDGANDTLALLAASRIIEQY